MSYIDQLSRREKPILVDELFERATSVEAIESFAHYTTLAGFHGILSDGGWWFSDCTYLNDVEEIENGYRLLENAINSYEIDLWPFPKNYFLEYLQKHRESQRYKACVACFSANVDSLDLWRTYKKDEVGVSAIFENFFANLDWHKSSFNAAGRVIYRDSEKIRLLSDIIGKYRSPYIERTSSGTNIHISDFLYLSRLVVNRLANYFYFFKNEAFSSENEIRQLCLFPNSEISQKNVRVTEKGLVPYVKFRDRFSESLSSDWRLPLQTVIVGPCRFQNEVIRSIRDYLSALGYVGCTVRPSTVPLRT